MSDPASTGTVPDFDAMEIVGDRLALMFINTTNWIDGAAVDDRIVDSDSLIGWADRVGIPVQRPLGSVDVGVVDVADVRKQIRLSLEATPPRSDAIDDVRSMIDGLADATNRSLDPDVRLILSAALFSAFEILSTGTVDQIRYCPGDRCGWMFIDTSPGKRRRWCSMSACGNRAKVKRHYDNTKAKK